MGYLLQRLIQQNYLNLKNGTFTTMVHGGEKKLEHFGFTQVTASSAINPAMVLSAGMQVMSMVSGTYYLNQN